jgi:hypothetical protein
MWVLKVSNKASGAREEIVAEKTKDKYPRISIYTLSRRFFETSFLAVGSRMTSLAPDG